MPKHRRLASPDAGSGSGGGSGSARKLPAVLAFPLVARGPRLSARWCTPDRVGEIVDLLLDRGYVLVSLDQVVELFEDPSASLPERSVALTFEVADATFGDLVWPALSSAHVPATLFVDTGFVGQRRRGGPFGRFQQLRLSWGALRDLRESGPLSLGTRGHYDVEHGALPDEVAFGDLVRSRREMERRLGAAPRFLRYPGSRVEDSLAALAARVGFDLGLVRGGPSRTRDRARIGTLDVSRLDRAAGVERRVRSACDRASYVGLLGDPRREGRAEAG